MHNYIFTCFSISDCGHLENSLATWAESFSIDSCSKVMKVIEENRAVISLIQCVTLHAMMIR